MVGLRASHIVRDDMNSDSFKRSPMLMVEHKKKRERYTVYTYYTVYVRVYVRWREKVSDMNTFAYFFLNLHRQ